MDGKRHDGGVKTTAKVSHQKNVEEAGPNCYKEMTWIDAFYVFLLYCKHVVFSSFVIRRLLFVFCRHERFSVRAVNPVITANI